MVEKDKFLVVISVLEGRRFPKRSKHKIITEARFDGELLSTDPVDHTETPNFTQELAWELDKKGLQQHRLQRTSIKIQCYACDSSSTFKEAIGYVVLDLRSVTTKQTPKWYPLLHSKYSKNKSEIRLAIYLENDKSGGEQETSFKAKDAPARLLEDTQNLGVDPRHLQPLLNEAEGYYQIGSKLKCKEQFVLSVTIAQAANLTQLIPSSQPLPVTANGYFFYFSLLGNDVTNETFHDLINPNFPAERASVKIRSNVDTLRAFFSCQPGIQIHLCCGEQSLGSCEIPLKDLLVKNSTEIYMKPVSIEGSFQLIPPNKTKQQITPAPGDLAPTVGVSIVLRKEEMVISSTAKNDTQETKVLGSPVKDRDVSPPRGPASPAAKTKKDRSPAKQRDRSQEPAKAEPVKEIDDYEDDFEDGNNTQEFVSSFEEEKGAKKATEKPAGAPQSPRSPVRSHPVDSQTTTSTHLAIPPQAHHFTFSIDLRSIKDFHSTSTLMVFIRYSYPFFGSAAPILTNPPVEIRKGTEVILPQSFCAFDFACTTQQLQETFLRVPLIIEVWHRDKQLSQDVLVGSGQLPLDQIITTDKFRVSSNTGSTGWRQTFHDRLGITANDSSHQKIGEVCFVLCLEDWGPITAQQIVVQQEVPPQPVLSSPVRSPKVTERPVSPEEPRKTAEYQAAVELEMWKETQEQMFENQLKQKEIMYMKALAEEWKKRDREREIIMKKKMAEYTQSEEKLRKTLLDLQKREKQLAANEQEVMRQRGELQREHDRKLQEMKEASHRMKEDCQHQVELERMKVREIEGIVERYKNELSEMEKKYRGLEKEFAVYKEQQNSKPEVRLQSEINLLTLEKVELERKIDALSKSKLHYKQQWGRALKELARLKQKEQASAKAELKRQQQELEHMRLRYLAAEEKEVVNSEKKELEELKNELSKLKKLEEEKGKFVSDDSPRDGMHPLKPDLDYSLDDHITRLIEERDTLLRTGVYSTQDKIIAELDRQIRESIAEKKTNAL
ncbi:centrosomal protein of 120 kDa-like isoform X1 [Saccostrea echinata]|uniref:centrosomal protein of 120 kDa-like isoform X1 n=1 Tax=Saccostrea echinata TaxID=191078 RepID=UPI002A8334E9|nr:centrosomal protein of 120 kDa-like isoform X1 [Saccostrea echinata]